MLMWPEAKVDETVTVLSRREKRTYESGAGFCTVHTHGARISKRNNKHRSVKCDSLVRTFGHQSTSAGRLVAEMAQTRSQVIAKLMEGEQK